MYFIMRPNPNVHRVTFLPVSRVLTYCIKRVCIMSMHVVDVCMCVYWFWLRNRYTIYVLVFSWNWCFVNYNKMKYSNTYCTQFQLCCPLQIDIALKLERVFYYSLMTFLKKTYIHRVSCIKASLYTYDFPSYNLSSFQETWIIEL